MATARLFGFGVLGLLTSGSLFIGAQAQPTPDSPPQPIFSGYSPTSGAPGTKITVTGTGMSGITIAWVGDGHDAAIENISDTTVVLTVPEDATSGGLAIGNGTHWAFSPMRFTLVGKLQPAPDPATVGSGGSGPSGAGPTAVKPDAPSAAAGTGSTAAASSHSSLFSHTPPPRMVISVSGNHFVDANGKTVQLRGVNVSGLEGVAIAGWSPENPWGGQTGDSTPNFNRMKSWGINAVRIPLNEASWLGLSCVDVGGSSVRVFGGEKVDDKPGQIIQADPGKNYQSTVRQSIAHANAAGMYVILDLHWAAPNKGSTPVCPNVQNPMADADHSIAFWSSIATAFKDNPGVIFELFNEPFLGQSTLVDDGHNAWYHLLNGGKETKLLANGAGAINLEWNTAGMQQMLDAVRSAGATNVVLAATDHWSQTMDAWLQYAPKDPAHQLGAVWHAYPGSSTYPTQVACPKLPQCSAAQMKAVQDILAAGYPVVATEFGDGITSKPSSNAPWASILLPFADQNGISYLGWTWDTWGGDANVLITDEGGAPTNGYGTYVKQHYLCVARGATACP